MSLVHVFCRTPRQVNAFAVLRLCLALANRCCACVCEVRFVARRDTAEHILVALSGGLGISFAECDCDAASAFVCPVRFGNTKTCPDGGRALACGCFECARRTQSPRFHLGASVAHPPAAQPGR